MIIKERVVALFSLAYDTKTGELKNQAAGQLLEETLQLLGRYGLSDSDISFFWELTSPDLPAADRQLLFEYLTFLKFEELPDESNEKLEEKIINRLNQLSLGQFREYADNKGAILFNRTPSGKVITVWINCFIILQNANLMKPEFSSKINAPQINGLELSKKIDLKQLTQQIQEDVALVNGYKKKPTAEKAIELVNCYEQIIKEENGSCYGTDEFWMSRLRSNNYSGLLIDAGFPQLELQKIQLKLSDLPYHEDSLATLKFESDLGSAEITRDTADDQVFKKTKGQLLKSRLAAQYKKVTETFESINQGKETRAANQRQLKLDLLEAGQNFVNFLSRPLSFRLAPYSQLLKDVQIFSLQMEQLDQDVLAARIQAALYNHLYFLVKTVDPKWLANFEVEKGKNFPAGVSGNLMTDSFSGKVAQASWPREIINFLKEEKNYRGTSYEDFFKESLVLFSPRVHLDEYTTEFAGAPDMAFDFAGGGFTAGPPFIFVNTSIKQEINPYVLFNILAHEAYHNFWHRSVSDRKLMIAAVAEGAAYLFETQTNRQLVNYLTANNKPVPESLHKAYLYSVFSFWAALEVIGIKEKPIPTDEKITPDYFRDLPPEIKENRDLVVYPANTTFFKSCWLAAELLTRQDYPGRITAEKLAKNPVQILELAGQIEAVLQGKKSFLEVSLPPGLKIFLTEKIRSALQHLGQKNTEGKKLPELYQLLRLNLLARTAVAQQLIIALSGRGAEFPRLKNFVNELTKRISYQNAGEIVKFIGENIPTLSADYLKSIESVLSEPARYFEMAKIDATKENLSFESLMALVFSEENQ